MWKRVAIVIVVLVAALAGVSIISHFYYSEQDAANARRVERTEGPATLSREDMQADIAWLRSFHERVHPPVAEAFPISGVEAPLAELSRSLPDRLSTLEFYRQLAPVVNGTGDEHTFLEMPHRELLAEGGGTRPLFPVPVEVIAGRLFAGKTDAADGDAIEAGLEIISINGAPAADILNKLAGLFSGTDVREKHFFIEQSFPSALYLGLGFENAFEIALMDPDTGETTRRAVQARAQASSMGQGGLDPTDIVLNRSPAMEVAESSFRQLADGRFLFDFVGFADPQGTLDRKLDDLFAGLRSAPASALIIDMRRNQGGDTRIAGRILSRLCIGEFKWFDHAEIKVSPEVKDQLLSFVPGAIRWTQLQYVHPLTSPVWQTPDGGVARVSFPPETSREEAECYDGRVAVLMGVANYSAAASFLDTLKGHRQATLVGERSGGFANHYGNVIAGRLPNSKLRVVVPTSYNVGHSTGAIEPDVEAVRKPSDLRSGEDGVLDAAIAALGGP